MKISDVEGTLREDTSILDPEFIIDVDTVNITKCNYIYIPDFERYYFVNEIISVRKSAWKFICHVDVLSTYKNQLRSLSGVIARQEYDYNLMIDDDKFIVNSNRMYVTKAFPNRAPSASGGASFVMSVAGGPPHSTT